MSFCCLTCDFLPDEFSFFSSIFCLQNEMETLMGAHFHYSVKVSNFSQESCQNKKEMPFLLLLLSWN